MYVKIDWRIIFIDNILNILKAKNIEPEQCIDGVNGSMLVSKTKGLCSNRSRCAILRISVMVAQVTLDDLVLVRIQYPQLKKNIGFLLKIFQCLLYINIRTLKV